MGGHFRDSLTELVRVPNTLKSQRAMSRKRLRLDVGCVRRPIDKQVVFVSLSGMDATQQTAVLMTATFPCTLTGIRWELSFCRTAGTGLCQGNWALVVEKEGNVVDTLATANTTSLYDPEQNILTFGTWAWLGTDNVGAKNESGNTKTMRKMQIGDRLIFIGKGVATETSYVRGSI